MIEINNLCKNFNKKEILKDITFKVDDGIICGLVSKNGGGKTTLIDCLSDITPIEKGSFTIKGKKIWEMSSIEKQSIGLISLTDNPTFLYGGLKHNLKIAESIYSNFDSKLYYQYAKFLELNNVRNLYTASQGEYQKFLICIELAHNPDVLFIDESLSVLDPIIKDKVFTLLRDFVSEGNKSIIISSQAISDLEEICDQIIIIKNHKVIDDSSKDEILDKYVIFDIKQEDFDTLDKEAIISIKNKNYSKEIFAYKNKINKSFFNQEQSLNKIVVKLLEE